MTYDKTSRKKILDYAEQHGVLKAIDKFELSRATYYSWKKQLAEDYVKPERKPFFRKLDPEQLKSYVLEQPDLRLKDYSAHFGVSDTAIFKALRKLGFTFKKKDSSTKNATNKSAQNIWQLSKNSQSKR